jgi:hypothetical protein
LKTAPLLPIESGRTDAIEIVDPRWESQHGHAVAALRYGPMSRPGATEEAEPESEDPRARHMAMIRRAEETEREDDAMWRLGLDPTGWARVPDGRDVW